MFGIIGRYWGLTVFGGVLKPFSNAGKAISMLRNSLKTSVLFLHPDLTLPAGCFCYLPSFFSSDGPLKSLPWYLKKHTRNSVRNLSQIWLGQTLSNSFWVTTCKSGLIISRILQHMKTEKIELIFNALYLQKNKVDANAQGVVVKSKRIRFSSWGNI